MSGRAQKETGPKKVLISSGSVFIFLASIRQIYAQPSAASQSYSAILLPYMDFYNPKVYGDTSNFDDIVFSNVRPHGVIGQRVKWN